MVKCQIFATKKGGIRRKNIIFSFRSLQFVLDFKKIPCLAHHYAAAEPAAAAMKVGINSFRA